MAGNAEEEKRTHWLRSHRASPAPKHLAQLSPRNAGPPSNIYLERIKTASLATPHIQLHTYSYTDKHLNPGEKSCYGTIYRYECSMQIRKLLHSCPSNIFVYTARYIYSKLKSIAATTTHNLRHERHHHVTCWCCKPPP